jgi:hypothetical protein
MVQESMSSTPRIAINPQMNGIRVLTIDKRQSILHAVSAKGRAMRPYAFDPSSSVVIPVSANADCAAANGWRRGREFFAS